MNIKLIVVDLDGTILADKYTIHPLNVEVIKELRQQGYQVVIATGRPYGASCDFYQQLDLDSPIINYNGALIHHPLDPKFPTSIVTIPLDIIYRIEEQFDLENMMCEYEENAYMLYPSSFLEDYFWNKERPITFGKMKENLKRPPLCCVIQVKEEKDKEELRSLIALYPDFTLRFWEDGRSSYGELTYKNSTKDQAINYVAKNLGIEKSQIMTIGDAGNDYEMIANSPYGVAMANAVDSVKQVAKHLTAEPCSLGGAGKFLRDFFKI